MYRLTFCLNDVLTYYKTQLDVRNALFSNSITSFFVGLNIDTVRMVEKLNRTLFSVMSHTHCASAAVSHVDFFRKGKEDPVLHNIYRAEDRCVLPKECICLHNNVTASCKTFRLNVCISRKHQNSLTYKPQPVCQFFMRLEIYKSFQGNIAGIKTHIRRPPCIS